jgi:hypothetical protein
MTSFTQAGYSTRHPDAEQAEAALQTARELQRGFDSGKSMAAVLLASIVSALLVVADQLLDTWADGQLMVAWVSLWAVGFVAIALLAGTVRRFSGKVVAALDSWAARMAQARADERLWSIALKDARLMAELQSALARDDAKAVLPPAVVSRARAHQTALAGGAPANAQP